MTKFKFKCHCCRLAGWAALGKAARLAARLAKRTNERAASSGRPSNEPFDGWRCYKSQLLADGNKWRRRRRLRLRKKQLLS